MSGRAQNDFLTRFSGKIGIITKNGQMTASEPPTPGISLLNRMSQMQHRSTASTINQRKPSLNVNHNWLNCQTKESYFQQKAINTSKSSKLKLNGLGQNNNRGSSNKKPFISVANNLVNNRENEGIPYQQGERKSNSICWVMKDKETRNFFQELDSLPFAKSTKDPLFYRS